MKSTKEKYILWSLVVVMLPIPLVQIGHCSIERKGLRILNVQ